MPGIRRIVPVVIREVTQRPWDLKYIVKGDVSTFFGNMMRANLGRFKQEYIPKFGFEILLDPTDSVISGMVWFLGTFERPIVNILARSLEQGDTFVDVGANIGWFTLVGATLTGRAGRVYAFEPDSTARAYLTESVRRNGLPQVTVYPYALWNSRSSLELNISESSNKGTHSVKRGTGNRKKLVQGVTLDEMVEEEKISHIKLLKIDVEGAEPEVIDGAKECISEGRVAHIVMEWNPEAWEGCSTTLSILRRNYDASEVESRWWKSEVRTVHFELKERHQTKGY